MIKKDVGMSLVEVVIMIGVLSIVMAAMMSLQSNQLRSTNYLEFQLKRTSIESAIIGQVLSDPENCRCLFTLASPSSFSANPVNGVLTVANEPDEIGRYLFTTPGDCSSTTMPIPILSSSGSGGVRLSSVRLTNLNQVSGNYFGRLAIVVSSTKQVLGPTTLPISIPVSVRVTPAGGGLVNFANCSYADQASESKIYKTSCIWGGPNPVTECTPPPCPAGDTNISDGCETTYSIWGGASGFRGGNCYRNCLTRFDTEKVPFEKICNFQSSNNPTVESCSTASCGGGAVDKGVYCFLSGSATGGPTGTSWGGCKRQCFL